MKKIYRHKDVLFLLKPDDVTFARRYPGTENTLGTNKNKGISTLALAVAAAVSEILYSAGAVAVIQPLPNPVSGIIDTTGFNYNSDGYYVSNDPSASAPASVSAEIKYNGNLKLYGNIADENASGPVSGKIFDISSKFTYGGSSDNNNNIKIYAGYSKVNGAVTNNTLNFSGSTDSESPNPNTFELYGGYSNTGNAEYNKVNITGSISVNDGLMVYGGQGSATVSNNSVTISSGTLLATGSYGVRIYGGYSGDPNGCVNKNSVTFSGGTLSATESSVVQIYGGQSKGQADENIVYLIGGTFIGNVEVYGGKGKTSASNNKIYVAGNINLDKVSLYGGYRTSILINPIITGNTLIFGSEGKAWTPDNYTIKSVNNFSTIRFDNATWGKTITITNFANASTDSTDPTVTKIDASKVAFSGVDALSRGDSYDMLTIKTISLGSIALASTSSTYTLGTTLQGTGTVSISDKTGDGNNDTVTYTIDSPEKVVPSGDSSSGAGTSSGSSDNTPAFDPQPQTHGVSMVNAAVTTALTQGADTTSAAISNLSTSGSLGVQSFSSVGGGASRTETGSHVSAYGLNFSVGAGNNIKTDFGLLSFGGAFEAGYGKFKNSYNAGDAEPYIGKKGHYSYYGVALMGNYAFENLYHVNAALRVGKNQEQSE